MMRVLVTGSSGFVGAAVCEELAARGCAVTGFDRAPSPFGPGPERFSFVAGDIRDGDALRHLFSTHHITHLVHAAAITPSAEREKTAPDEVVEVNVLGACRVMKAAAEARLQRVLYLSSISAVGDAAPAANGRFTEDATSPRPSSLYGITKLAAEVVMRRIADLQEQDLRTVRLGPLFGPWEHASRARDVLSPHHQIIEAARAGRSCVLPRNVAADWLYSRDGARRIVDLLLCEDPGCSVFNLGGDAVTTLADWCEAVQAIHPGFRWRIDAEQPTIRYSYSADRPALDNSRLDAVCPSCATPLAAAARETWAWFDRPLASNVKETKSS